MVQFSRDKYPPDGKIGSQWIYEALKRQISDGVYAKNGQIPSSRGLAHELGVSRTTVIFAFEQLAAEGFIEVRQGSRPRVIHVATSLNRAEVVQKHKSSPDLSSYGRFVQSHNGITSSKRPLLKIDFRYGDLSTSDFPITNWKKAINIALLKRPPRLTYGDAIGSKGLRRAIQRYLWSARMIHCDLAQIIIVSGSQQALDLCARILLDRGDQFVIENPCYGMARKVFEATGAAPIAIEVGPDGLDVDNLDEINAQLAYVTPSHQFPLGSIMSASRRSDLVEWAVRKNAYIVEDDYDSEFRYDISPVPTLYGLGERVIYVGTVSKTLSPTLRIGYLVVPAELQNVFAAAKQMFDRQTSTLEQDALAHLIESGFYDRHVRRMRRRNKERRQALLNALREHFDGEITIQGTEAGLHLVVWFINVPSSLENKLVSLACELGVGLYPVSSLYWSQKKTLPKGTGLVFGYSALTVDEIKVGISILSNCIEKLKTA